MEGQGKGKRRIMISNDTNRRIKDYKGDWGKGVEGQEAKLKDGGGRRRD